MATLEQVRREYDSQAEGYNDISHLPRNVLKAQLLEAALGDCTGLHVLDLGGGPGLEARQAISAGAATVDIVDLSDEMLRVALETEEKLGRSGRVRGFQADATQPLAPLRARGLRDQYDLVMSNFCFDHASTRGQLEAMWRNATDLLRPGGRFVGARVSNMRSEAGTSGKYGITYKDFHDFPGGTRYRYRVHLREPIEFEVSTLELSYGGSTEIMEMCGLTEIEELPPQSAKTVRDDPEFWDLFLRDPSIAVVKAVKK
ncbi:Malonyl-O-methyltransferase [Escovopsis weberi]|uniref:Malonyl-O-methyltransferase n=1 Tax=Escovopsis weberi TaxID=150374 RepID=A0A0M8N0I7_ESCWE|nr:Malonyl-O-methyltransferase [Escovopsis weberi]